MKISTLPVGNWPSQWEEKEWWFNQALSSPNRDEAEKTFLKRLMAMGVSYEDIYTCNLARKRKQRSELYNSTAISTLKALGVIFDVIWRNSCQRSME